MSLRKKSAPVATVNVQLDEGDWLDVMDNEGTWNAARILSFPSETEVEVTYDGWGDEYNEVILLNSERVAPYHTCTWSVKCWARYKNWPWWPSIVTIRSPGTEAGQRYLATEKSLFVDFLDNNELTKRCRCWVDMANITPFDHKFDERRKRTTGTAFEASFAMTLKSTADSSFPKFSEGSLPVAFTFKIAESVKQLKLSLGMDKWVLALNSNRHRHRSVYRYKALDGKAVASNQNDDDDPEIDVRFEASSDEEGASKSSKARLAAKKKASFPKRSTEKRVNAKGRSKVVTKKTSATRLQDAGQILDGPHAPSPRREEEQPVELPLPDDNLLRSTSRENSGGSNKSSRELFDPSSIKPIVQNDHSRKRKPQASAAESGSLAMTSGSIGSSKKRVHKGAEGTVDRSDTTVAPN